MSLCRNFRLSPRPAQPPISPYSTSPHHDTPPYTCPRPRCTRQPVKRASRSLSQAHPHPCGLSGSESGGPGCSGRSGSWSGLTSGVSGRSGDVPGLSGAGAIRFGLSGLTGFGIRGGFVSDVPSIGVGRSVTGCIMVINSTYKTVAIPVPEIRRVNRHDFFVLWSQDQRGWFKRGA